MRSMYYYCELIYMLYTWCCFLFSFLLIGYYILSGNVIVQALFFLEESFPMWKKIRAWMTPCKFSFISAPI